MSITTCTLKETWYLWTWWDIRAKSFFRDKSSLRLGEDVLDSKQETFLTKQISCLFLWAKIHFFSFFYSFKWYTKINQCFLSRGGKCRSKYYSKTVEKRWTVWKANRRVLVRNAKWRQSNSFDWLHKSNCFIHLW